VLSFSPIKLLIVLVVAAVLVGPDKVPQVARQLGAAWRAFRSFHERVESEVRQTIPDLPSTTEIARLARSPVAFLNQLADLPASNGSSSSGSSGPQETAEVDATISGPGVTEPASTLGTGSSNAANGASNAEPSGAAASPEATSTEATSTEATSSEAASSEPAAPDSTSHGAATPPLADPSMN
jgi:TatA/E family protein of Tat protein translocase